ncbi:hypothetical protein ACFLEY_47975 (plasmid) [Bradyrhizobium sp. YCK136]|jgi:hypothetical protein|uniref:Type II toxin-antitoxin system PemK/MazF family toxin n=1 Tax=Bradyrhizobium diazoefficiens TaxID=1355477 RepID=A0A0E4BYE0_9BRAD|nr:MULTISPECIES: hypothetical protein [Bradyrhizobium]BAR63254.1 putative uncharacterized protein [Bradyrhizobium diazoefficiens]MBR0883948.1 hypothetical protein [Bradyrhizobium liaoningense]MBR0947630.1 hypothetical protein [Bradyrhizobium liaoningense]MBR1004123.1 hypothetical protein [Bradyrhizobium liaoningense]MBR1033613.1 hypothetical protein [Bradyrhizobium liaoningense]
MTLEPRVGWLLSYSYLWADDQRRGDEEGSKTRPCALVAASRRDGDRVFAIVVPVTQSWPRLFGQRPAGFKWIPAGLC